MDNFNLLPKKSGLVNYYYYKKNFTDDEIERIIEISKKFKPTQGNIGGNVDLSYRVSKITWLPQNDETKFIYDKIIYCIKDANKNMWNFNITNVNESIQFTEYDGDVEEGNEGHYDWHMDFGEIACNRKISLSVQLSDENEYEGGEFEFMFSRSIVKAPKEKGTVVVFPSYLLHRVKKVTKGKRRSLVFWINGPPFV
jgi:PKHD-type hydroxylase